MSKVLVVFGATGQQGGSVVRHVLSDPQLSKEYHVRAVTRDPSRSAAKALQQLGAEVVQGDADDPSSLTTALKGAHTVFAVTLMVSAENVPKSQEYIQGKAMADAAVAVGAEYFILSTLSNVSQITNGKITNVEHFDQKAQLEEYVRTLPIKSAFYAPGFFMQNFINILVPQPVGDGSFVLVNVTTPQTQFPLIDIVEDTGKFIGSILMEPARFEGKTVRAAERLVSLEEIAETMSHVLGKTVRYNQIPKSTMQQYLPPSIADEIIWMYIYYQDFGYFGPQTKDVVKEAAQVVRGKLTTFEEFLTKNVPPTLK
ncbi:hypothetical protein BGW36DRAFT_376713 [Talaromyces proteolyticus]|uniref:NmrA-like domain-containing protein n=1 Tax=Talaromyces proteolyticus TaxID=1131652 RepID=A0AAD4PZ90_9EURO|nr:uncharacterized protein BGW36DRAFT_376713 [Talaromyces proteolyticus]KAH8698771.1 hypothetical protein BGW36DRAFT_376713 [Talaromyces proteolyticus]